jgi:hypothetical protein
VGERVGVRRVGKDGMVDVWGGKTCQDQEVTQRTQTMTMEGREGRRRRRKGKEGVEV